MNPHGTGRNPSGSSSGSGVAVAAGLAPLAIGTETDGSIISPSTSNGIVGIKPTLGLVSRSGIVPISSAQDTAGPMTRCVADAAVLLGAIAGLDPADPPSEDTPGRPRRIHADYTQFLDPAALAGARIGIWRAGAADAVPGAIDVLDQAVNLLREAGAVIIDPVELAGAEGISKPEFTALGMEFKDDLNAYLASVGGEHPMSLSELIEFNRRNALRVLSQLRSGDLRPGRGDRRPGGSGLASRLATRRRTLARGALDGAFAEHGLDAVVIVSGNPAWLTDYVLGDHYSFGTSSPSAVSGYPAITVPAGLRARAAGRAVVHGPGLERAKAAGPGLRVRTGTLPPIARKPSDNLRAWTHGPLLTSLTCPGVHPTTRIWDTSSNALAVAAPGPLATIYACGITPYDATHMGHAATYIAWDLLNRSWRDSGRAVRYAQNVTDVDDPLLERAGRDGDDWRELADREIERYRGDMAALRVLPPDYLIGAVEALDVIEDFSALLAGRDALYELDDDVYALKSADPRFGSVSGFDVPTMLELSAERGGDPGRRGKKDPLDPLIWLAKRPGEPHWDSRFGPGRPGWHVECAAIASRWLGVTLRRAGRRIRPDLPAPRDERVARAGRVRRRSAATCSPARYVHAGMVRYDGEKMSKSLGNLVFVSRLRGGRHRSDGDQAGDPGPSLPGRLGLDRRRG